MVREETGLSLSRACELAGISRASVYYRPVPVDEETLMLQSLGGPAVHGLPVLRDAARELAPSKAGPRCGPRPGAEPDGGGELADGAPRSEDDEAGAGARGAPASAWGHGGNRPRPGDLLGHHVHSREGRGYLYLVAVMDWSSRFVLSWELDNPGGRAEAWARSRRRWSGTGRRRYRTPTKAASSRARRTLACCAGPG